MVQISQTYYNDSAELSFFATLEINLKKIENDLISQLMGKLIWEEDIPHINLLMNI
jgi:hypothetical protein